MLTFTQQMIFMILLFLETELILHKHNHLYRRQHPNLRNALLPAGASDPDQAIYSNSSLSDFTLTADS